MVAEEGGDPVVVVLLQSCFVAVNNIYMHCILIF
jgi:hypothetical protein